MEKVFTIIRRFVQTLQVTVYGYHFKILWVCFYWQLITEYHIALSLFFVTVNRVIRYYNATSSIFPQVAMRSPAMAIPPVIPPICAAQPSTQFK